MCMIQEISGRIRRHGAGREAFDAIIPTRVNLAGPSNEHLELRRMSLTRRFIARHKRNVAPCSSYFCRIIEAKGRPSRGA